MLTGTRLYLAPFPAAIYGDIKKALGATQGYELAKTA